MGIRKRIRKLEGQLKAEIVIQEEKSHFDQLPDESDPYFFLGGTETKVIDQPRIAKPDIKTRHKAFEELNDIYESSKWYQFIRRYLVERALRGVR